ncbi:MAG: hypothetical protein ABI947_00165, partial [Chloroflexota bacterium]
MTTKQSRLTTFEHQIRRLDKRLVSLRRVSDQISALRLAIFAGGFVLAFIANFAVGEWAFWLTSAITIVAFALAVRIHRRILRSIAEVTTWRQIKARQIARMTLDWAHIPLPLPQSDDPLSVDLDLVGERSIHHLLDTAISYEGSQRLRDWLLNTQPNPQTIAQRQALVKELLILPLFRDKLNLRGRLASAGAGRQWKVKRVLDWFDQQAPTSSLRPTLQLLTVLACINIALFALSAMTNFPSFWVVTLLVYLTILFVKSRDLAGLFEAVLSVQDALSKLSAVFSHLEKYPYRRESRLKSLCQPFLDSTNRPSAQLRRIARVATAVSVTHTPSLWLLINAVVPWDMYFAHLLNGYKAEITALLPDWLEVWIELEALSSLANFGTLNPEYTFPDIAANTSQSPVLEARQLGHPLLTEDHKICNDFTVDKLGQVITITGSNMSGKSTFLRTLGINLCLAYAGSPVNAVALRTAPFRV